MKDYPVSNRAVAVPLVAAICLLAGCTPNALTYQTWAQRSRPLYTDALRIVPGGHRGW